MTEPTTYAVCDGTFTAEHATTIRSYVADSGDFHIQDYGDNKHLFIYGSHLTFLMIDRAAIPTLRDALALFPADDNDGR